MLKNFLQKSLQENGYQLSDAIQEKILKYLALLQHWNKAYNLTAIRDPQQMVLLHILDSLSIQIYLKGPLVLDVGTGAGLPGIPLALITPQCKFVLLDSQSKKIRFLTQVQHELQLDNVDIVHSRCEEFHPTRCFNTVVARAFAAIPLMLASTEHLLCQDGQFLAMKGVHPEKELAEIPTSFTIQGVHSLQIKGINAARSLVCLKRSV